MGGGERPPVPCRGSLQGPSTRPLPNAWGFLTCSGLRLDPSQPTTTPSPPHWLPKSIVSCLNQVKGIEACRGASGWGHPARLHLLQPHPHGTWDKFPRPSNGDKNRISFTESW